VLGYRCSESEPWVRSRIVCPVLQVPGTSTLPCKISSVVRHTDTVVLSNLTLPYPRFYCWPWYAR